MPETIDHYTSWDIAQTVDETTLFVPHYLDSFGRIHSVETKTVDFQSLPDDRRISPFVSPLVEGHAARKLGHTMSSYQPGYVKDMETVDPEGTFERMAGEAPSGQLSPSQRLGAQTVAQAAVIEKRYRRRMEVMASQLVINGFYIMEGELFDAVEINFGRNALNTYSPLAAAQWTVANIVTNKTVSPMDDIEDMVNRMKDPVSRITFGPAAWAMFRKDPEYKTLINTDYSPQTGGNATLPLGPQQQLRETTRFVGRLPSLQNVPLYVDNRTYTDNDGTEKVYTGTDQVVFEGSAADGFICHAIIQNILADYKTMEKFWRSWTTTESALPGHFVALEAAVMLAHTEIDSTAVINTKG